MLVVMARPPRHRIELSDEERCELERVARSETMAFRDVQRARIVLYAAEGLHDTEIAARLGHHARDRGQVATKIRRAAPGGFEGQAARGSPAPFSPRNRSPRSRRSRASCRSRTAGRWAASRALSCIDW